MYIYSTRMFYDSQPLKKQTLSMKAHNEAAGYETYPDNTLLETVILRDMKIAYGMQLEMDFITKLRNLKVFVVELNDLRGSDRVAFPKLICEMTKALSVLRHLECVELT
jgi:hypothetical protein